MRSPLSCSRVIFRSSASNSALDRFSQMRRNRSLRLLLTESSLPSGCSSTGSGGTDLVSLRLRPDFSGTDIFCVRMRARMQPMLPVHPQWDAKRMNGNRTTRSSSFFEAITPLKDDWVRFIKVITEVCREPLQGNFRGRQAQNRRRSEKSRRGKLPALPGQPMDGERILDDRSPVDDGSKQRRENNHPGHHDRLRALRLHLPARPPAARHLAAHRGGCQSDRVTRFKSVECLIRRRTVCGGCATGESESLSPVCYCTSRLDRRAILL